MINKSERAVANFKNGYNCSQAVLCAFCEECGISEETAIAMAEAFGGGLAGMRTGPCGAVSGMAMAVSLMNSAGNPQNPRETKASTYGAVRELTEKFRLKNGSYICGELLGLNGTKLRSCEGCVQDAAELFEEYLSEKNK